MEPDWSDRVGVAKRTAMRREVRQGGANGGMLKETPCFGVEGPRSAEGQAFNPQGRGEAGITVGLRTIKRCVGDGLRAGEAERTWGTHGQAGRTDRMAQPVAHGPS